MTDVSTVLALGSSMTAPPVSIGLTRGACASGAVQTVQTSPEALTAYDTQLETAGSTES